ncbi:hypothetical protein [Chelativorans xinjiangense]|uniref:hypothetical protein n=1 Tax=Chelativorans xinjiangense TaxID=2681485 RepID=UPI00135713CC|nr:hypothetical protein [Chelativorans xinjiangense]
MATIVFEDNEQSEITAELFKIKIRDGLEIEVHCPPEGHVARQRGELWFGVFGKGQALVVRPGSMNTIHLGVETSHPPMPERQ